MPMMDKIVVEGGTPLRGTVRIGGSKNAVLPVMAATLLAPGSYRIRNVPRLRDVQTMGRLLESTGVKVRPTEHELFIDSTGCSRHEAPYDLVKTMRASIYVLGPLLSRFGYARVSLPGGCAWGPRPVNLHIEGMKKLGADVEIEQGYIIARAKRLRGARVAFDPSSVGATGNVLLASVLAEGETLITHAAVEPEITALARFLEKMGAKIEGIGTSRLTIQGVESLHPADDTVIPDRVEAGTFLAACAIAGGDVTLEDARPDHLSTVLRRLEEAGCVIDGESENTVRIRSDGDLRAVDVKTGIYPGFPTDMQAQWMAVMSVARGSSVIEDTVYLDRFTHVPELRRLGADITLDLNTASVRGVPHLSGAPVMSTDLRASASLILAGLVARGRTDVSRIYHIDRGYERIEEQLKTLGANIRREKENLVV
jgi:UDP-N-acetylglucosamine 1-carboxyvinyltransferase